jgi:hypothetical protein
VLSASPFLDHLVLDLSKANEKMIKIVNKHPLISLGVFTPPLWQRDKSTRPSWYIQPKLREASIIYYTHVSYPYFILLIINTCKNTKLSHACSPMH